MTYRSSIPRSRATIWPSSGQVTRGESPMRAAPNGSTRTACGRPPWCCLATIGSGDNTVGPLVDIAVLQPAAGGHAGPAQYRSAPTTHRGAQPPPRANPAPARPGPRRIQCGVSGATPAGAPGIERRPDHRVGGPGRRYARPRVGSGPSLSENGQRAFAPAPTCWPNCWSSLSSPCCSVR